MKVAVSVPATSANLGPAFDCLGIALRLRNHLTVETAAAGWEYEAAGESAESLRGDAGNLAIRAVHHLYAYAGKAVPPLRIVQENNVPLCSGLGSSATAILTGLLAANALLGDPMGEDEILRMATELEGHPDNVAPALLGGAVLVNVEGGRLLIERLQTPPLEVVVVLPDFLLATTTARAALPRQVPLADAVFNAARTALLVRALEQGDFDKLRIAMQDRLHQPYRVGLIPGMAEAFVAGRAAGAPAVALSGAGPAVIALTPDRHDAIAQAMQSAFAAAGLESRSWVLPLDTEGSIVTRT